MCVCLCIYFPEFMPHANTHTHSHFTSCWFFLKCWFCYWMVGLIHKYKFSLIFSTHLTSFLTNENYISHVFVEFLFYFFCWYVDDNFVLKCLKAEAKSTTVVIFCYIKRKIDSIFMRKKNQRKAFGKEE